MNTWGTNIIIGLRHSSRLNAEVSDTVLQKSFVFFYNLANIGGQT